MGLLGYLACVFLGAVLAIGVYMLFFIAKDTTHKKLREYKFLLRWWLIGKYYCESSNNPKILTLYKTLNKIFWGAVSIGLCLVVAEIIEAMQWIIY